MSDNQMKKQIKRQNVKELNQLRESFNSCIEKFKRFGVAITELDSDKYHVKINAEQFNDAVRY